MIARLLYLIAVRANNFECYLDPFSETAISSGRQSTSDSSTWYHYRCKRLYSKRSRAPHKN